ncbi:MAG: methylmalonyl-CoA mutase family protein [Puniceicoccales bacterium]
MESSGNPTLLAEFEHASYEAWRSAAEALLKGAPFDKIMRTPTPEGITLQPIYRREDLVNAPAAQTMPGSDGFTRGASPGGYREQPWRIAQEIPYGDPTELNRALLHDLARGQDAINLIFDIATMKGVDPDAAPDGDVAACGLSIASLPDMRKALNGVFPTAVPIYFQSGCSGLVLHTFFRAWLSEQNEVQLTAVDGGIGMDPLAYLARAGELPAPLSQLLDEMAVVARDNAAHMPKFTTAGVSGMPYHCAGGSATQELAAVLASGLEYLRALTERGLSVNEAARQIHFTLSVGPNFFMEIAKFRAARPLWAKIVAALGGDESAQAMRLNARTGLNNKTRHDPYVNMLRTTTEALGAVIGGVESLCVGTFDEIIRSPNEFSRRIARNTQIILQEECELTGVVDPAGGSWFVENLTQQVAEAAWKIFQEIEKEGGMSSALQSGFVQQSINAAAEKKSTLVGQRRLALVGTNQYPNLTEKPLEAPTPNFAALRKRRALESTNHRLCADTHADKNLLEQLADIQRSEPSQLISKLIKAAKSGATLGELVKTLRNAGGNRITVERLPDRRLAEIYERLRDAADVYRSKNGHGPKLFLINLGILKRHKLRADFTRSFFETGGFEIIYSQGFSEAETAVGALKESGAKLAVICGTDDDYVAQLPTFAQSIKAALPDVKLILAGFPGEHEATYREAGLDDYIFVKSDNYATNRKYLEHLGVL